MSWPHVRDRVTVVDVLDAGACIDGVKDFILLHSMQIAGNLRDHLSDLWITRAAHCDGHGDGDGDGDGDGYGDGYGYGYGYGYGDGYGNGIGDGDGAPSPNRRRRAA